MKNLDNVETKKLLPIIKAFLENVDINFDPHQVTIEEFEWQSRDGFSAHSHNRGGMDLIGFTTNAILYGSGYHSGTSIEDQVNKSFSDVCDEIQKENPELT